MKPHDYAFTSALCVSLMLHALLALLLMEAYIRDMKTRLSRPVLPLPPQVVMTNPFGEAGGGIALHATPAADWMNAPPAEMAQALLRMSSELAGVAVLDDAEPAATPVPAELPLAPFEHAARFGPGDPDLAMPAPRPKLPEQVQPMASAAAAPGPHDAESDPFQPTPARIEFRGGRIEARFGRQIKPTRPRLTLAGLADLNALQFPPVVLRVEVDEHGHVRSARVYQSSGSNAIDLPSEVAVYDWWFEPPVNQHGDPVPDVVFLQINWR